MSRWFPRLTDPAKADFVDIVGWTREHFGEAQARTYLDALYATIRQLADGPEPLLSRVANDMWPGVRRLTVARRGIRARHVIYYKAGPERRIWILRILHDQMDPNRQPGLHEDEA